MIPEYFVYCSHTAKAIQRLTALFIIVAHFVSKGKKMMDMH